MLKKKLRTIHVRLEADLFKDRQSVIDTLNERLKEKGVQITSSVIERLGIEYVAVNRAEFIQYVIDKLTKLENTEQYAKKQRTEKS